MADVVRLVSESVTADELLEAYKGQFKDVIIVGFNANDDMSIVSTSGNDESDHFWLSYAAQFLLTGD